MAPAAVPGNHDEVSAPRLPAASPLALPLRRRVSMEEDFFYQEVMTTPSHHRPSSPPGYAPPRFGYDRKGEPVVIAEAEPLPQYTCDVQIEGVFNMKMEIIDTIKRAPARNWRAMFVKLEGTKLSIYSIKKDWGLGRSSRHGAQVFADNPPWVQKGKLEKTYTLLHADVGIAADYEKYVLQAPVRLPALLDSRRGPNAPREVVSPPPSPKKSYAGANSDMFTRRRRYVIRVRAETDQFLLSCIELETFVRWLDAMFAAINIAPTIDERDFPRDQSIPRRARLQYFRTGTHLTRQNSRASDVPRPAPVIHHSAVTPRIPVRQASQGGPSSHDRQAHDIAARDVLSQIDEARPAAAAAAAAGSQAMQPFSAADRPGHAPEPFHSRLSTTSYPNESIHPETGKWRPRHEWTSAHDMVYAKLCYAVLLFRSPRKSNYVIAKGKKWFVDWTTGRMIRVLPPGYFEHEVVGPWQVWSSENRRI